MCCVFISSKHCGGLLISLLTPYRLNSILQSHCKNCQNSCAVRDCVISILLALRS